MNDENEVVETSIWPILVGLSLAMIIGGLVVSLVATGLGVILLFFSLGGWTQENRVLARQHPEEDVEE